MVDQAVATIVIGAIGASIATVSIWTSRSIARKRATIDFLCKYDVDDVNSKIVEAKELDELLFCTNIEWENLSQEQKNILEKDFYKYELMALGVYSGALDEGMCFDYVSSYLTAYRKYEKGLIGELRAKTRNNKMFHSARRLMQNWARLEGH